MHTNFAMAILVLSLAMTVPTQAQQKVYVADRGVGKLYRMDTDGGNLECVLGGLGSGCLGEFTGFSQPYDVAFGKGLMFVSDNALDAILVADEDGQNECAITAVRI